MERLALRGLTLKVFNITYSVCDIEKRSNYQTDTPGVDVGVDVRANRKTRLFDGDSFGFVVEGDAKVVEKSLVTKYCRGVVWDMTGENN